MRIQGNRDRRAPTSNHSDDQVGSALVRIADRVGQTEKFRGLPKGYGFRVIDGDLYLVNNRTKKKAKLDLDWTDLNE
jgi:hypothetical protein